MRAAYSIKSIIPADRWMARLVTTTDSRGNTTRERTHDCPVIAWALYNHEDEEYAPDDLSVDAIVEIEGNDPCLVPELHPRWRLERYWRIDYPTE